ncbi:hypothetical protein [Nocardia sp. NPDC051463]|uniref:hypothetical protein n=1 Tax=Nocardia sp. NPDC051463 TaxID=3154845 RepID=UPI00341E3949
MTWPEEPNHRSEELVAMLPDIARRPGPKALPKPISVLQDQILLHTSALTAREITPLPSSIAGLVLAGKTAAAGIKDLRRRQPELLLLRDPEGYRTALATEDEPFVLEDDEESQPLFPLTLDQHLQAQRDCGADLALTPTGYLSVGDSDALRAVVRTAASIERDDVVISVPLDIAWLKDDHINHVIAVLATLDRPKAVFLGGQFDPMERYKAAVQNLRRLVAEADNVAVLRTDLTGFDVMSHGAYATSIGTGGSMRHMIPFGETPFAQQKDPSPSVLFEPLMSFHKGSTLAQRFANTPAPVCHCLSCQGQPIDRFLSRDDRFDAHRHSINAWASWANDLHKQPTLANRATWWKNRSRAAVAYAETVNVRINQPDAFQASKTLQAWAELPQWWARAGANQQIRTR